MNIIQRAEKLKETYGPFAVFRAIEPLMRGFPFDEEALRYHVDVLIFLRSPDPDQSIPVSLEAYRKVQELRKESQEDAEIYAYNSFMRDCAERGGEVNSFWIEVILALAPEDNEKCGINIRDTDETIDDLSRSMTVTQALSFTICRVIWCSMRGEAKAAYRWVDVLNVVRGELEKQLQNSWSLVDTKKVYQTAIELIDTHGLASAHVEAWAKKRSFGQWYESENRKFWNLVARLNCGTMRHGQRKDILRKIVSKAEKLKNSSGELAVYRALLEMLLEARDGNKKASWFWLDVALYLKRLEENSRLPIVEKFIKQADSFKERHDDAIVYDACMELTSHILAGNREQALEWIGVLVALNKRDQNERFVGDEKGVFHLWDLEHRYSESKLSVEGTVKRMSRHYDEIIQARMRAVFKCLYSFDYLKYECQWEVVPEFWLDVFTDFATYADGVEALEKVERPREKELLVN